MNKQKVSYQSKKTILIIFIIILGLSLGINLASFIKNYQNYNTTYVYKYTDFVSYLKDENYPMLIQAYYSNEMDRINPTELEQPYFSLAQYYEAASYYFVYEDSNPEEAKKYKDIMNAQIEFLSAQPSDAFINKIPSIDESFQ